MKECGNIMKEYEILEDVPQAMEWDKYETILIQEYKNLLKNKSNDEKAFQVFFEMNPCMLPGAFGFFGESGHAPINNALITQPQLIGTDIKIPDFLWFATDSCTIYPVFIEIEKPSKKWFVKNGQQSAEFTQAQNQLTDWKIWFSNTTNQNLFFETYNIDTSYLKGKSIEPYYVIIYGSRDEFDDKPELSAKRSKLQRPNEIYMTFDRISPNIKGRNIITCTVNKQRYYAKYVQPVFRLGPVFAEEMSKIQNKKEAINGNALITKERREFLVSRISYWDEYGKKSKKGLIYTSDWE